MAISPVLMWLPDAAPVGPGVASGFPTALIKKKGKCVHVQTTLFYLGGGDLISLFFKKNPQVCRKTCVVSIYSPSLWI